MLIYFERRCAADAKQLFAYLVLAWPFKNVLHLTRESSTYNLKLQLHSLIFFEH